MFKKNIRTILIASIALAVTACASTNQKTAYQNIDKLNKQQQASNVAKIKDNGKVLNSAPDWFLSPPVDDEALYSVATDYSNDLQFAVDKAVFNAKVGLATQINNRVSSKTKEFAFESGNGSSAQLNREFERASRVKVTDSNLSGYTIIDRVIIQQGVGFRVYVLLRYPLGEGNKIATEQKRVVSEKAIAKRAEKAQAELEQESRELAAQNQGE